MNTKNLLNLDEKKVDYLVDKSNFRQAIIDSPDHLRGAIENWKSLSFGQNFSNVILCGMGGSAWPMEFVINYITTVPSARLRKIPFIIHRNYGLPDEADKESLMIFCSYSGNTEETIAAYEMALKAGIKGVVITSGGLLEELAIKNGTIVLKVPKKNIPSGCSRCATGYMVGFLLKLLADAKIIKDDSSEIMATSAFLNKVIAEGNLEKRGYELAKKIGNKIVLIYASVNYRIAAKVWKIKINENAKMPAFWNHLPEFNHNEMVGFTRANPDQFIVVMLENKKDNEKILKVTDISKRLLSKRNMTVESVGMEGDNFFSNVFYATLLGDWVSYYLSVNHGIDPSPVAMVDEFKKELKNIG